MKLSLSISSIGVILLTFKRFNWLFKRMRSAWLTKAHLLWWISLQMWPIKVVYDVVMVVLGVVIVDLVVFRIEGVNLVMVNLLCVSCVVKMVILP